MIEHLNNIISDIDLIKKSSKYNLENIDIKDLEDNINKLKKNIDLDIVDMTSGIIYDLNLKNDFSDLIDHISNEFYAFKFMLKKNQGRKDVNER